MWSDILWFKLCFPDTAPICVSVAALRTLLLSARGSLQPLKHFFGSTFLQTPVWHLSWRSQSICDCLVEMDLNYSNPASSLLMGYWREETDWSHSLCGQALGVTAMVKSHCPFPKWFSLPGVVSDSLTCTSIKFWNKVERKEKHIYWVSPIWTSPYETLQIHSLVKGLVGLTLLQEIVSEGLSQLTKVA